MLSHRTCIALACSMLVACAQSSDVRSSSARQPQTNPEACSSNADCATGRCVLKHGMR